jgi:tetratricopeptide (TPR) repeat protein
MAKIVSSSARARLTRAVTAHQAGRLTEAEAIYRDLLRGDPDDVDTAYNLAVLLAGRGAGGEALGLAERALVRQPKNARLENVRGIALAAQGRWREAVAAYEEATRLDANLVEAQSNLSLALRQVGEVVRAIDVAERATVLDPKSADAFNNLGNALDEAGERTRAEAAYERAVTLRPDFAMAWHNYANLHRFTGADPMLAKLLAAPMPHEEAKSWLLFARGKAEDDLDHLAEAAKLYRTANDLMRGRGRFDFIGHGKMLDQMKAGFSGAVSPTPDGDETHRPILILGASRAGKSLVERLLADGREVVAFGEHLTWQGALAAAGVTEVALRPLPPDVGAGAAAAYSRPLAKVSLSTSPGNLMFAGMFLDAFPQGRVIWVRREMRDHALRIYFKRYNAGNAFAYDLNDIAKFLIQFDGMMAHWKARYGERVVEVRYEKLIEDPKAALAALGLPVREVDLSAGEIGRWRDYAPFWPELDRLGTA